MPVRTMFDRDVESAIASNRGVGVKSADVEADDNAVGLAEVADAAG